MDPSEHAHQLTYFNSWLAAKMYRHVMVYWKYILYVHM